ncbi:MAG: alpha/beta hydrolase [Gemmatimonadetes bacterium]|nr:alpha/beta hydrolase [Gemmatimonadota bacterium]
MIARLELPLYLPGLPAESFRGSANFVSEPLLHHHVVGADDPPHWIYVLHGIYGAGRNWASFAKRLTEAREEWGVVLVDLRMHGHSTEFEPPHTLSACVADLSHLVEATDRRPTAVLGHSFGGKIALMSVAAMAPAQVWVIDSTPSRKTPGGAAYRMLQILKRLPGPFPERADAVAAMEAEGFARNVAAWMATNLVADAGGYWWRFESADMEAMLDDFFRRDLWDVVEAPAPASEIHLVQASESDVIAPDEYDRFVRASADGRAHAHRLRGGHWLHVDNPDGLLGLLVDRLP